YKQGVDAAWLPALEYMRLDEDGRPEAGEIKARVIPLIRRKGQHRVYITQGFIGRNRNNGEVATLSRGGSDYTATLLGEALGADEVQIWTDVDGVYSADPRIVPNAHCIATMSYSQADAAARLGAKILHPECVLPAMRGAYRLWVLDSFHPDAPGTLIGPYDDTEGLVALARIKGDNESEISIVGHKSAIERISSEQLASLPGVNNIRKADSYVSMTVDNSLSDETMRTIHKLYFE
ncbi:MAG: hypothetical protein K2M12_00440, partial [Muribaculaceae bacterium]|nr:hypothetical protein [Muribaculaceae bacterium]